MKYISRLKNLKFVAYTLAFLSASLIYLVPVASAAYLTNTSIVLTNMNAGGASSVVIQFTTPSSSAGTGAGSLVFSGWTGSGGTGTVAASPTVGTCTSGIYSSDTAMPGTVTPTGTAATGTISWTDTTSLVSSTTYCFTLVGAISANPTTPGETTTTLTEGTATATSQSIDIISNDQVTVSASVPTAFTMAFGNSDSLGTLSSGTVSGSTGITVTVNTNAKTGWSLWGSDANGGLKSTTQSYTIPSKTPGTNGTLTAGTEGYLSAIAGITQGTGAGTTSATSAFASSGVGNGSGLNTTNNLMASSTGTANNAQVPIKEYAAISSTTPAANDYSDTITLVGAGSF
ncbi:MAG TPA: hypothetical protein VFN31_02710 [Candidatus Saccharimonadales bacterium]|nr:hypothetical protein [Candidatus Saccharimonadales bacterium]